MKSHKKLKILLIIIVALALIAAGIIIGCNIYANTLRIEAHSDDTGIGFAQFDGSMSQDEISQKSDELEAAGYHIYFPRFADIEVNWTNIKFREVYTALDNGYMPYIYELADTYNNYVKLDYTFREETDDNGKKTLTVSFTGFGYKDDGKGEEVKLDRDYVYDITNIGENTMPILLTEYDYPDYIEEAFGL